MKISAAQHFVRVQNNHILKKHIRTVLITLSVLVTFCVFWYLKLVGITLAGDAFCGFEEHTHTSECITKVLSCEMDHDHSSECYKTVYVCGLEEHIHVTACYSDVNADVENEKAWQASFSDVVLGSSLSDNIILIAKSQLGYSESEKNFSVDSDNIKHGYTRYGEWYGNPYGDWNAMFVNFCLHYSGVYDEAAPYNAGVAVMFDEWLSLNIVSDNINPSVGDIVFLDTDSNLIADSVGIIEKVNGSSFITIQGDYDNKVSCVSYEASDSRIIGLGLISVIAERNQEIIDSNRVNFVIEKIDSLPSLGEIESKYESLSYDEQDEYYEDISLKAKTVYAYYEDLPDTLKLRVSNYDKLSELEILWGVSSFAIENIKDSISVTQVNRYSSAVTSLVYGGSIRSVLGTGMSYTYWDLIMVDLDDNGNYFVSQYIKSDISKLDYSPSTSDGFMLLLYDTAVNAVVGDGVEAFDFRSSASGTVSFGTIVDNTPVLDIIQAADTDGLIEVNLYNYGNNINDLYTGNNKYPGFQQDNGTKSIGSSIGKYSMNFGNNITADLLAGLNGITNNGGDINTTNPDNVANLPISGVIMDTLKDGYPALTDGTSLKYLFSDNVYAQKVNNKSINGLFLYNNVTGEYTFDSRKNHAQYNFDDTFLVFKQIITPNFIMYPFGNFLPLNDIYTQTTKVSTIDKAYFTRIASKAQASHDNGEDEKYSSFTASPTPYASLASSLNKFVTLMDSEYGTDTWNYETALQKYFTLNGLEFNGPPDNPTYFDDMYSIDYNNPSDFYFGMEMHMTFIQPKNGLTGLDGNQEMVFYFTGDDDVWVFIDGKLALDLSGIHRHVGGNIDFVKGTVTYDGFDPGSGDVEGGEYKTVSFAELFGEDAVNENGTFKNYSSHTFDFYYMERGAGSGVCRMNFNLPLLHKNSISVSKELSGDDSLDVLGNPDFSFQIFKENGNELLIGENYEYSIYNSEGMCIGTEKTGENGIFTIKADQRAVFENISEDAGKYFVRELLNEEYFEQYGQVVIDGTTTTSDGYTNVTIGSDTFKGIDSTVKDISDGSTLFSFNNNITFNKLGSLQINKVLESVGDTVENEQFKFNVSIDGNLIPEETVYYIVSSNGSERQDTVKSAGEIIIKADETARIENILAGSKFEVSEINLNNFTVVYSGDNLTDTNGMASGYITADASFSVTVTNIERGVTLEIPVLKSLINPDGITRLFKFNLVQVTDQSGAAIYENGQQYNTESDVSTSAEIIFTLPFKEIDFNIGSTVLYYKISEISDSNDHSTIYDASSYVVEVTVTKSESDFSAVISNIWKDGVMVSDNNISFTNEILRSLKIQKQLEGNDSTDKEFTFSITASSAGQPLIGSYYVSGLLDGDTVNFVNGVADVTIKPGGSITIEGLPVSTEWIVEETSTAGYFTKTSLNNGEFIVSSSINGTLDDNSQVLFINIPGPELPGTGGLGNILFTLGGIILIIIPLMYGLSRRRRRERRVM